MCIMLPWEKGLFHALQWLSDMQFDDVDVVLDSKITIDVFHHRQVDVTKFRQGLNAQLVP